jgi:hypothetical protein
MWTCPGFVEGAGLGPGYLFCCGRASAPCLLANVRTIQNWPVFFGTCVMQAGFPGVSGFAQRACYGTTMDR